jgi:CAP-Gly domain
VYVQCADATDNSAVTDEDAVSLCSFGSRADLHRLSDVPMPSWVAVGEPVHVVFSQGGSRTGYIQFVGTTEFAPGNWVGVELDAADGKFCIDECL